MDTDQQKNPVTGVPKQAFEQFLSALEKKNISAEVLTRLRKTLIEDGDVSDTAVKVALFPDNNTPQ